MSSCVPFSSPHNTKHKPNTLNRFACTQQHSYPSLYADNHIAQAQPYFGACSQLKCDSNGGWCSAASESENNMSGSLLSMRRRYLWTNHDNSIVQFATAIFQSIRSHTFTQLRAMTEMMCVYRIDWGSSNVSSCDTSSLSASAAQQLLRHLILSCVYRRYYRWWLINCNSRGPNKRLCSKTIDN